MPESARDVGVVDLWHLTRRFFSSLVPVGPSVAGHEYARSNLLPGELVLFDTMSGADQRHHIAVARRVEQALGPRATQPVMAAALLHDVGKIKAGLGTFGRVAATLARLTVGRNRVRGWASRHPLARPFALYLDHPELGASMLEAAGSHELAITWTREHHLAPERWTVPRPLAVALKHADDD